VILGIGMSKVYGSMLCFAHQVSLSLKHDFSKGHATDRLIILNRPIISF
jgi:hypothetical protein